MSKKEICCIGHITHDKIITPRHEVEMPGGTAYYFAHGIKNLDTKNFQLVTAVGNYGKEAVDDIRKMGIDVKCLPSKNTVYFENKYGQDMDHRTQRVRTKADPFTIDGLKDVDAKIYHLGTLLADDFSLEVLKYLSTKGIVSVDAQGYLREVVGEDVRAVDWPEKLEALPYIDILKANEHEAEVLTGSSDPYEAAKILHQWGVKEPVITLGSHGSLIYSDGEFYKIPAYQAKEVVDATGCGDTYMTGYLYQRAQGKSVEEAGDFAAAMCTLKLESSGPFKNTVEDIYKVIEAGR